VKHLQGDWLEIAKALPHGSKVRTQCSENCGADNSQIISHSPQGYSRYCFRCKGKDFQGHGQRRIGDIERHKKERAFLKEKQVRLPDDYTLDVPTRYAIWYIKYGISPELARQYEIGYSEEYNRIVLPVKRNGLLTAVQMRAVEDWMKPKYLNPTGPSVSKAVFMSGEPTGTTVVVEDIISAIKVGKVHHATSILGTNMTDERALEIASLNHTAIVWTDNDKAGVRGRIDSARQLRLLGMDVYEIRTPNDPKTYSLDVIKENLKGMKHVD
jgi:hypothetical protein